MSARILLVADAADDVGLGHVSRASALAAALRSSGVEHSAIGLGAAEQVHWAGTAWQPLGDVEELIELSSSHPVTFLDSYLVDDEAGERISSVTRLAVPEDRGEPPARARLVLAPSQPGPDDERTLRGFRHACLGESYWISGDRPPPERVDSILVTTGAADRGGHGAGLASVASELAGEVKLVSGPQSSIGELEGVAVIEPGERLPADLAGADLVITGAGQTMLEACALGIPTIAVVLAPNQRANAEALEELGAVRLTDPADRDRLGELIGELSSDPAALAALSQAALLAVDGRGALRVAAALEALTR